MYFTANPIILNFLKIMKLWHIFNNSIFSNHINSKNFKRGSLKIDLVPTAQQRTPAVRYFGAKILAKIHTNLILDHLCYSVCNHYSCVLSSETLSNWLKWFNTDLKIIIWKIFLKAQLLSCYKFNLKQKILKFF